jgi:hypothetical protein
MSKIKVSLGRATRTEKKPKQSWTQTMILDPATVYSSGLPILVSQYTSVRMSECPHLAEEIPLDVYSGRLVARLMLPGRLRWN